MDQSRIIRPGRQTQRQTSKITAFGSPTPVTKVVSPRFIDGIGPAHPAVGQSPLPVLRPMTEVVQPQPAPVVQLAARAPLDMELPGEASPSTLGRADPAKWRRVKRGARRGLAATAALLILVGGVFLSQGYLKL